MNPEWTLPIPFERLPAKEQKKALDLRSALDRALQLRAAGERTSKFERAGMEDFEAVFGYTLPQRRFRQIFYRTIARAGAAPDWQRPDIYVDERFLRHGLTRKPASGIRSSLARAASWLRGFSKERG